MKRSKSKLTGQDNLNYETFLSLNNSEETKPEGHTEKGKLPLSDKMKPFFLPEFPKSLLGVADWLQQML